ncbi:MAG: DUF3536 domain-containing protein [Gemmatimonadota bacterium]|nr:DUF3536 domain-containing protein [Gemmatimonadota bacterium]
MTLRDRSVVIHAHFYQPPREDPWLDEIPQEASAAPFHDWNARIERECYRAVTAARIPGPDGRIARITNTLEQISFDAGPTLMAWLESGAPETYRRMIEADRVSCDRLDGHGNAIAAPFHHVILPLASRRDKRTEILWGLADFRLRFGREATGCWLPETAVDDETLDVLAECGLQFTILAPHQVAAPPPRGRPGRYRTAGGRELTVAIYDGPLSHDVAFGPLIRDATRWAAAVTGADADLVGIATDGETYGHHHRFGEMALAAVLADLSARPRVRVENFAAWLARQPAADAVVLRAPSSWSCAHGIERWRADCGCRLEGDRWPSQAWRGPLRDGLVALQTALHARFAEDGAALFTDAWAARDAYGEVLSGAIDTARFLDRWAPRADAGGRARAAGLLAMERHALGMMTSCGWFFDDVSGLESVQVLRYAARAVGLAGAGAEALEAALLDRLASAVSNDPKVGTARDLYVSQVAPLRTAPARIAAAAVAAGVLGADASDVIPNGYELETPKDAVIVRHVKSGEAVRVPVRVTRPRPGRLEITAGEGADAIAVPLAALPERARDLLTTRLRREVMDLWLTEVESAELCVGAPLPAIVEQALLRAIAALETDTAAMATAQVLDLLDLADLCAVPVPYDAQTAFDALCRRQPASARDRLAPIADRLGLA